MKMYQLLTFNEFYNRISKEPMNITVAYALNKIYTKAKEDLKFYEEGMNKILGECIELDENGQFIRSNDGNLVIKEGKSEEIENRINELRNLEVEIDDLYKIDIDLIENFSITPQELLDIGDLINM